MPAANAGSTDYVRRKPWTIGHLPALDGLRGLAILLVLLCHLGVPLMGGAGAAGVTVFFVLSGFLITSLLVRGWRRNEPRPLHTFYLRRVRRLLPALLALLGLVACVDVTTGDVAHLVGRVIPALVYVYNWICVTSSVAGDPIGQTWSLSIEEQFYLLWPLVLLVALRRRGPGFALRIALAGVVLAVVDRAFLVAVLHASTARLFFASDTNALPLMAGCGLALALSVGKPPRIPTIGYAYAGVAMFSVCALTTYGTGIGFTLAGPLIVTAATTLVIARVVTAGGGGALTWGWSRGLGRVSYSLYLWQTPVILWGGALLGDADLLLRLALLGGLSLGCAIASYRLVETPWRRVVNGGQRPTIAPGPALA